jgi:DNA-binding protein YbaB
MSTPLPSPQSLLSALNTLERALSDYERGREATTFSAASSDGKVNVSVNGIGRVTRVQIDESQLTLAPTALATKVLGVVNSAIDAAYAATAATIASFASGLSLPGLPGYGSTAPDYLDFLPTADSIRTSILANNPCAGTTLYTCASGPVTAVVNRRRHVVSLTYPAQLPKFASYLAQRTLEALNCAVDKSTDAPDIDPTPGIVDSRNLNELVVYAKTRLTLADRVKIKGQGCSGWGNIANSGTVETNIGADAEVGNVLSRAKVVLRDRGKVHGFLDTGDVLENHPGTVIDGAVTEHAVVILPDLLLNVPFPSVIQGTIELEPNQQQTAAPGYYNRIHPKSGAQVFLSAGVYYCNEFFLEPGSTVWLATTGGPVVIWVRSTFTFRGTVKTSGAGGFPRLFAGYLGTDTVIVESAWKGTLAAPNAKISVSTIQNHEGAFHAKEVQVQPDCGICHQPFELHYDQLPGTVPTGGVQPSLVDLGFENISGWSSPQAMLASASSPLSQGVKALVVTTSTAGLKQIVSDNFAASLAAQGCTRLMVDVYVPAGQTAGNLSVVISVPSAGVNNVNLGSLNFAGHPTNQFSQFEFALPAAVRTALDGNATDVKLELIMSSASGPGPWYLDNVRFLLPVPPLSSLDAILSFEDITKWSSPQTSLTTNTQFKTHLTKSLRVTTAPGSTQILSVPFPTGALNAPLGKFRIDLRKPNPTQPNPSWHGQFQLQIDVPSAGIASATTGTVELTPLAANTFATIELALPASVLPVVNGEYDDLKLKLILNVVAGSGPWHLDNIRFV